MVCQTSWRPVTLVSKKASRSSFSSRFVHVLSEVHLCSLRGLLIFWSRGICCLRRRDGAGRSCAWAFCCAASGRSRGAGLMAREDEDGAPPG